MGHWHIVLIGVIVNLHIGLFNTWSLFEKALVYEHGWSNHTASLPYGAGLAVYAVAMLFAGILQRRLGSPNMMLISGLSFAVGLFGASISQVMWTMTVFFGGFVGIGIAFAYMGMLNTIMTQIPAKYRGVSSGLLLSAFALSSASLSSIVSSAISANGVHYAFRVLALIISPVIILAAFFLKRMIARDHVEMQDRGEKAVRFHFTSLFRSDVFWSIFFIYFAGTLAGVQLTGHITHIALLQASMVNVTALVSGYAMANCGGRLITGFVLDRMPHTVFLMGIFAIDAVNMLLFSTYQAGLSIFVGLFVAGVTNGSVMVTGPQLIVKNFNGAHFSSIMGIVSLASGIAGVLGPPMYGAVVDAMGDYEMAYLIGAVLLFAACAVAARMHVIQKREQVDSSVCFAKGD